MLISTRGRYALRILIELAEQSDGGYVSMRSLAQRQGVSLKYLEQILPVLTRNGLLEGVQGKGGGYRLCRSPEDYTVGEILRLTEGELAPVGCLDCMKEGCDRAEDCRTRPLWQELYSVINTYLDGVTLADLMEKGLPDEAETTEPAES